MWDLTAKIVCGGPEPENIHQGSQSFGELIFKRLTIQNDYIILIDALTGTEISSIKLRNEGIRVANYLLSMSIGREDRIAIYSENRLEYAYVLFAAMFLGITIVPISYTYVNGELQHAITLTKPNIIFTSSVSMDRMSKAIIKSQLPIRKIIVFDDVTTVDELHFAVFMKDYNIDTNVEQFKFLPQNIDEKVALIFFSSGTTGLPKGVQLTEKNLMASNEIHFTQYDPQEAELVKDKIVLSISPWSHVFGCISLIIYMLRRDRIVFLPKFMEHQFLAAIQKYKVNTFSAIPVLMSFLAKSPSIDKYDLSSLKVIKYSTAPLSMEIERAVRKRLNNVLVRQAYGMTEATMRICVQTYANHKHGSVGAISDGMIGKIVDTQSGTSLGPNEIGELCFKGNIIMKGYLDNVVATQSIIDSDGWLHSGDIGYVDETGEYYIIDRIKELIKYKGYPVPPVEIEKILFKNSKISDAAVIGVPDSSAGELPMAFVVKEPNCELTEMEVIEWIATRMEAAKRLRGGVRFIDAIPRNATGKILRRVLKDLVANTTK